MLNKYIIVIGGEEEEEEAIRFFIVHADTRQREREKYIYIHVQNETSCSDLDRCLTTVYNTKKRKAHMCT